MTEDSTPYRLKKYPLDADGNPTEYLRVSYSSLNVYSTCNRKFELQKLYPTPREPGEAFAADVGSALHAGYQNYLITQDVDQATWAYMLKYPYESERNQSNDYRSLEAGFATLLRMIESSDMIDYELATIKKPDGEIVPAIEVPFELRFKNLILPDGRGLAFIGFIDAIMRHLVTGQFRTVDIKTHRRSLYDATAKYKYDPQQIPYGIVVEHSQGFTIEDFQVVYLDCYVDILDSRAMPYQFTKTQDDIQEWLVQVVMTFQEIKRQMDIDFFPRASGGCLFYNKPCRFLDVCASRDAETVESFILMGNEPVIKPPEEAWIVGTIDPFGG